MSIPRLFVRRFAEETHKKRNHINIRHPSKSNTRVITVITIRPTVIIIIVIIIDLYTHARVSRYCRPVYRHETQIFNSMYYTVYALCLRSVVLRFSIHPTCALGARPRRYVCKSESFAPVVVQFVCAILIFEPLSNSPPPSASARQFIYGYVNLL